MANELVTQGHFRPSNMEEMMELARNIVNSKLAPPSLSTPDAVLVAMQHGMELGLSPMQAVQSIAVINGRPSIWGDAALALAMGHPDFEDIEETFERGATAEDMLARCEIKRKGRSSVVRTFSVGDARKAGLWDKAGPWRSYPKRMLQMRARSFAIRDCFPDALKGVSVVEEMRDVTPREPRKEAPRMVLPGDDTTALPVASATETEREPSPALPEQSTTHEPADQDGIADHDLFQ